MVYPILKKTLFPLVRLFLKEIKGMENIPKNGPFIITSNHESYIDPFLIGSVIIPMLNRKIHVLVNKGRFWDFFGNTISKKYAGCVCVEQGKEKSLEELSSLLKKKEDCRYFHKFKKLGW